jgi:hypothetical protein
MVDGPAELSLFSNDVVGVDVVVVDGSSSKFRLSRGCLLPGRRDLSITSTSKRRKKQ